MVLQQASRNWRNLIGIAVTAVYDIITKSFPSSEPTSGIESCNNFIILQTVAVIDLFVLLLWTRPVDITTSFVINYSFT